MLSDYTPTQGFVAEGFDGGTTFALTGENAGHWVEGAPSAALTTYDVRNRHAEYVTEEGGVMESVAKRNSEFDHWLAAHDEAVRADMQREIQTVEWEPVKWHELRADDEQGNPVGDTIRLSWDDGTVLIGRLTVPSMGSGHHQICRMQTVFGGDTYVYPHGAGLARKVTPSTPNQQGAEQK